MSYYEKYLKYKNKYEKLKNTNKILIGGNTTNINYDELLKNNTERSNNFDYIKETYLLVESIHNVITNHIIPKKKTVTIIGIGDSPVIFLQIYEKIYQKDKTIIKYFPISGLRNITEKERKKGIKSIKEIGKHISTDIILWVDFVSTGKSFMNFMDLLPNDITKKSYYCIYGNNISKNDYMRHENNFKNKLFFYNAAVVTIFFYLIASTIGNSEYYSLRCVNKNVINDDFKVKFFNSSQLPIEKNKNTKNCISFADYLYNKIKITFL